MKLAKYVLTEQPLSSVGEGDKGKKKDILHMILIFMSNRFCSSVPSQFQGVASEQRNLTLGGCLW